MSDQVGKVFKSGNSLAVRLPKNYTKSNSLRQGQTIRLSNKPLQSKGDVSRAIAKMQTLADKKGSIKSISDPSAWQRAIRDDRSAWHEVIRDIGR